MASSATDVPSFLLLTCDGVTSDLAVTVDIPVTLGGRREMHTSGVPDPFYYLVFVDFPNVTTVPTGIRLNVTVPASTTTVTQKIPIRATLLPRQSVRAGRYTDQFPVTGKY